MGISWPSNAGAMLWWCRASEQAGKMAWREAAGSIDEDLLAIAEPLPAGAPESPPATERRCQL